MGICFSILERLWLVEDLFDNSASDALFFFPFIFISWRLITLQYCSGFCHTLTWISHGFTCIPHPDLPSHHPLHPISLGLPSAPGLSTCLMPEALLKDPLSEDEQKKKCVVNSKKLTVTQAIPRHSLWMLVWSYAQNYNLHLASNNFAFSLFPMLWDRPEPCISRKKREMRFWRGLISQLFMCLVA